jgi:hypothetical protein
LALNLAKLVTAIILHIVVMPEVSESINLMQYSINHFDKFKIQSFIFPFLIALMKLTGAVLTEVLSVVKINTASSVEDVVKDFIAFVIIAEIDNILVSTVKSSDKQDTFNT